MVIVSETVLFKLLIECGASGVSHSSCACLGARVLAQVELGGLLLSLVLECTNNIALGPAGKLGQLTELAGFT